jgi:hypothetical protein
MSAEVSSIAQAWPGLRVTALRIIRRLLARALPTPLAAGQELLTRLERRLIAAWLRPLEAITRLLLVAAALALPPLAPTRPAGRDCWAGGRDGEPRSAPGFRVLGGRSGDTSGSRAARPDPLASFPAWPLVARLEAVCGVIENPLPHVRRLARQMGRDAGGLSGGEELSPAEAGRAPWRERWSRARARYAVSAETWTQLAGSRATDTS